MNLLKMHGCNSIVGLEANMLYGFDCSIVCNMVFYSIFNETRGRSLQLYAFGNVRWAKSTFAY